MVQSDRLLLETDCPFLAPVPKEVKDAMNLHTHYVAEAIAHLRCNSIAAQTTENACELFGLSV